LFRRASLIATALAIGIGAWLSPSILERLLQPAGERITFILVSIRMFVEHPLSGVGPGMWVVDRIRYTEPPEPNYYVPHAHNVVAQSLAELGVVGVVAGAIVIAVMVRLIVLGVRSEDRLTRRLGWAALFGGFFVLIQQLVESYTDSIGLWLCFALVIAHLDARATRETPPPPTRRWAPIAGALALTLGAAGLWIGWTESAALQSDDALFAANRGDWAAATDFARSASERDPLPPYLFALGVAEAYSGDQASALLHMRAAVLADDYPTAWLNVAELNRAAGQPNAAREALARAMRLGYQEPQVAVGASTIALAVGDRHMAVTALAAALASAPGLASDPYWMDPSRRSLFDEALDKALEDGPPSAWLLALEGSRPATAAGLVAKLPEDQREVPSLVIGAWAGDLNDFDTLHHLASSKPDDIDTALLCLRLAYRASEQGADVASWRCDHVLRPNIPMVVRVINRQAWCRLLPGADYWPHFGNSYHHQGLCDQLVPGIPRLVTVPP
jgi:tetratricopeptide (TPR) repeat protein